MKTAFCTNVFPLEDHPEACIELKKAGFDAVELWPQYLEPRTLETIRKEVTDLGLAVAQVCPYFNVTGTQEQLEASYRMAEQYVAYANALNCKNIRVFTGSVSVREATEKQYAQGVEGLRNICDIGKDKMFVLETHTGSLMETPETTLRLLEAVGRDNLRVNLQVPMRLCEHDPYTCAEMLGDYTVHLHAHNWESDDDMDLTYLDSGNYDFEKFLSILVGKGFDGYISIEHANHFGKHDPYEVAYHEAKYLKELIARFGK